MPIMGVEISGSGNLCFAPGNIAGDVKQRLCYQILAGSILGCF